MMSQPGKSLHITQYIKSLMQPGNQIWSLIEYNDIMSEEIFFLNHMQSMVWKLFLDPSTKSQN